MAFKVINNEVITDSSVLQNTTIDESNVLNNVFNVTDGTTSQQINRGGTVTFTAGAGVTITQLNGTVTISSDSEGIEDLISPLLVHGNHTYIDATYDDLNDQVLLAVNITTDGVPEGSSNLYYDDALVDSRIALQTGIYLDLSGKDTDDLVEGSTNLYYADSLARAAISASGDLSYNNLTGVISYSTPTNVSTFTNDAGYLTSYTETDPVFTASPAGGILAGDITNWNTAYGWGNHASAGYLTSYTDTNTTYSISSETGTGGANLRLTGSDTSTDNVLIAGGTNVTVTRTDANTITISSTDTNTTYTAGSGLQLTGTVFSNTAPDQTVVLTGSGATSITGTYPNFTISSTDNNTTYTAGTGVDITSEVISIGQDVATTADVLFNTLETTAGATIGGNLTVNGSITYINSNEVNIGDNIIVLNYDETVSATQNAGIEVERGTDVNVFLLWNETTNRWTFTNDGSNYYNLPEPSEYDVDTNTTYTISSETGAGGANLRLTGNDASTDNVLIAGGTNVTVTRTDANTITISSTDTNTTYTAGTGLSLVGTTFNNTSPDQVVSLTGGGATSITGTYPNFTISSTDNNTTYTAGSGIDLTGTTFSHSDTSSQTSLTALVGANVISDIDVDGFGHVTSLATRTMTLADLGYTGSTTADNYQGWSLFVGGIDRGDVLSGETIDFVAGGGIGLTYSTTNDNTITIAHSDTSAAANLTASSRRYVSGLTFDTYGHVTGYTTGTETVTDTNNYVSSLAFNTGDGVLTANRSGLTALTVDLDGRYLLSSDYVNTYVTTAAFNTADGVLTLTRNDAATVTVDLDGRYLESYTETQTLQDVTDLGATTTNAISITNATGATAYTNGALTVGGGVGVAENLYVNGTINGSEVNLSYTDFAGIANASAPAYQEGRMYYDTDAKTLVLYGDNSGFNMPVGEREWVRVINSSGATILKGQPVYATGVHISGHPIHGHHPTVALADASDVNKIEVLGLAAHDIADTAHGYVIVRGYIDNINTSTLTTGSRVHLGFASPGTIIDNAPGYPNYPVDLGLALTSDASTGTIYVDIQTHTFEELRLTGGGRVDGNWTVGGNLTVNGTTSIIGTTNLAVSNNFIYLNSGDTIGEANTLFTGSGLDDGSLNGHYTGTTTKTFYVRIDSVGGGTGGVDTFEWSIDNFSTTVATGIDVSTSPISLSDNITVMWEATTGHTLNATWYGTAAPSNVDNAVIGNRNTGATGVGYTHIGLFFDVSDEKWKLFSEYDPEPTGSINTADASFNLGTLAASAFEGNLTGDVTGDVTGNLSGNATTASAWATARTLTLSGDVTGTSAAFNGSGNISISTTIAPNSVALGTDTTGNYAGSITAGTGISVTGAAGEGTAYTIAHSDTSTATNLSATSRTYVNSLTFDTYGHVTAYGTATETVVDTNNYVSGVSFNTADGVLTLTRAGLGNLTVDLDGRYLTTAGDNTTYTISAETGTGGANLRLTGNDASTDDVLIAGGTNVTVTRTDANTITISSTDTNTTYSAGAGIDLTGTTFSHADTSTAANLTASGRTYVTGLTFDTYGHVTGYSTGTETVVNTDTNTTYDISSVTTTGGALLRLTAGGSGSGTDDVKFAGSGATTVAFTDANTITISSTDTNTTYTAGSGLQLTGTVFSNTAPDQTVTLTGAGATSITGTYPNFTISSTDTDTNNYVSGVSFNTADGVLTLTRAGLGNLTVDLDGRYLTSYTETDTLQTVTSRGNTTNTAVVITNTTASTSTSTGALRVSGGAGIAGNAYIGGNAVISGNLTVNGTTTTVNSTTVTLDDPIMTLGGDTAPTVDDNKDRGVEFRWHNGSAAKVGFFGFDDSTGKFTFIPDGTNTSEVFSGTKGEIDAFVNWSNIQGAPAYDNYGSWTLYTDGVSRGGITSGEIVDFVGGTNVTLGYNATNNTITINSTDTVYTLPAATSTTLGGIELFSDTVQAVAANAVSATASRTYGVQVNAAGQAVVNVPWVDTNTETESFRTQTVTDTDTGFTWAATGSAIADNANDTLTWVSGSGINIDVDAALDAIRISNTYSYTLPAATSTTLGGIELFSDTVQAVAANAVSATASRTYGVQVNAAGQAVVNVPWVDTDTNTTYTAGNGITLTGTTFSVNAGGGLTQDAGGLSHADTSTAANLTASGRTYVSGLTFDTYGHVTGYTTGTETVVNTETESFRTQTVTDTDTGYTWAATGSAVADSANDTLTWVSGASINIDVDAALDAIRITNTAPNVTTNITTTHAATTVTVNSSDGTNGTINAATTSLAGVMTSTDKTKLDGIETGATADQTAAEILSLLLTVDGAGSGLDADLLDGLSSAAFLRANATDTATGIITFSNTTATTSATTGAVVVTGGVGVGGSIYAGGDVTAYSDERLKENIETITDAVSKVEQLRGVTYTRKSDGIASTGVIAQDVEKVLPQAVATDEDGMMSVKYGNMVGLLIEAMKEQNETIKGMQAEIAELKARLNS